ncbi:hypothetical protein OROGR_002416 [Orobanche gracilis]
MKQVNKGESRLGMNSQGGVDLVAEPKRTKQVNEGESRLGMNSQGGVDLVAEPKRTKLDVDDPKVTEVEDGTEYLSFKGTNDDDDDGRGSQSFREFLERHFPEPEPWTREEEYEFGGLKDIAEKLAESGVDIKAMRERWKTCEVKCQKCGDIDHHPEDECPYLRFLYI